MLPFSQHLPDLARSRSTAPLAQVEAHESSPSALETPSTTDEVPTDANAICWELGFDLWGLGHY